MAEIVRVTNASETIEEQLNILLHQFNDRSTSAALLQALLDNANSELWVAREGGTVIGMATLVLVVKVGGTSSRLEDVIVHEQYRGKGLGRALCQKIIERAKERGAYSMHLTSRPDRVAANNLYQKLGFQKHETNAYRMQL